MRELYGNSEKDPVYGYLENPRELSILLKPHMKEDFLNEIKF
jgi:hypothetical protein